MDHPRFYRDKLLQVSGSNRFAVDEVLQNSFGFFSRSRDQTSGFKRAASAGHALGEEELNKFLDARNGADVLTLHVEEQRARHWIFTRSNRFERRRDAGDICNLQGVTVLIVEAQTEDADRVRVALQACKRLGVVAGDLYDNVLADIEAGIFGSVSRKLGSFAAGNENLFLEDFTGAVVGCRDCESNRLIGKRRIDVLPRLIGVVDQLAIYRDLRGDRLENMHRLEGEVRLVGAGREDNAIIAELDFEDLVHAGLVAGFNLGSPDAARGIGDVDRVVARTLAELTQPTTGTAGTNDRRLELGECVANLFSDDAGEWQHGRGASDLNRVARLRPCGGSDGGDCNGSRGCREGKLLH